MAADPPPDICHIVTSDSLSPPHFRTPTAPGLSHRPRRISHGRRKTRCDPLFPKHLRVAAFKKGVRSRMSHQSDLASCTMYDILQLRAHPHFLHGVAPEEIHARLGEASFLPANLAPASGFTYSALSMDFVLGAEVGEDGELEILQGLEVLEDEDEETREDKLAEVGLSLPQEPAAAVPAVLYHDSLQYIENIHEFSESYDDRGVGPLVERWALTTAAGLPGAAYEIILLLLFSLKRRYPSQVPGWTNVRELFSHDIKHLPGLQRLLCEFPVWGAAYEEHQRRVGRRGKSWVARCLTAPGLRLLHLFFFCLHSQSINTPAEGAPNTRCLFCSKLLLLVEAGFVETAIFIKSVQPQLRDAVMCEILQLARNFFADSLRWVGEHLKTCTYVDGQGRKHSHHSNEDGGAVEYETNTKLQQCFSHHHDFVVYCDAILLQRARMILAKKKGLERDLLLSESAAVASIADSFSANLDEF